MAQFNGKVSRLFTARYGGSFGLEGQDSTYFNTRNALPAFVQPGAFVSFDATDKSRGGRYRSFDVADASLAQAQPPAGAAAPAAAGIGSVQDKIQYQAARKDAQMIVQQLIDAGVLYNEKTPKAKIAGIIEDATDRYTALYYDDTTTLGALTRVPPADAEPSKAPAGEALPE